jgi:hypothetical protein
MRDERGELIHNAHLLGFFRRICRWAARTRARPGQGPTNPAARGAGRARACGALAHGAPQPTPNATRIPTCTPLPAPAPPRRLLFHKVFPVFVFDGATPALKRLTNAARRARREEHSVLLRRTAEKILMNQVKRHAVQLALAHRGGGGGGDVAEPARAAARGRRGRGGRGGSRPRGGARPRPGAGGEAAQQAQDEDEEGQEGQEQEAAAAAEEEQRVSEGSDAAPPVPKKRRLLSRGHGAIAGHEAAGEADPSGSGAGGSGGAAASTSAAVGGAGPSAGPLGLGEEEQLALALELSLDAKGKGRMPKALSGMAQAAWGASGGDGGSARGGGGGSGSEDEPMPDADARTALDAELAAALAAEEAAAAAARGASGLADGSGAEDEGGNEGDDGDDGGGVQAGRRVRRGAASGDVGAALAALSRGRAKPRLLRADGRAAARTTPGGLGDGGDSDALCGGGSGDDKDLEDEGVAELARGGGGAFAELALPDDPSALDPEALSMLPQSVQLEVFERIRDAQMAGEASRGGGARGAAGRAGGLRCGSFAARRRSPPPASGQTRVPPPPTHRHPLQPTATSLWQQGRRPRTSARCRWVVAAGWVRPAGAPCRWPLRGRPRACSLRQPPRSHILIPSLKRRLPQVETYLKASQFRQKVQSAKERLGQLAQAGDAGGPKVREPRRGLGAGWVLGAPQRRSSLAWGLPWHQAPRVP